MVSSSFSTVKVEKPWITIVASGTSVLEIPKEDFVRIKERSTTFFLNYAPCYFGPEHIDHLFWSDVAVSHFLDFFLKGRPPYGMITREEAFLRTNFAKIRGWITAWWAVSADKVLGNYSLPWLIQLLQRYFPDKPILVLGCDGYPNATEKWYDRYTSWDQHKRGKTYDLKKKVLSCFQIMDKFTKKENIFNGNPKSTYAGYPKKTWQEALSA